MTQSGLRQFLIRPTRNRLLAPLLGWLLISGCTVATNYDLGDAPDPSYPTRHLDREPPGPALLALDEQGGFLAALILGDCVTVETEPKAEDDCDDSQPSIGLITETLRLRIRRTGIPATGDYWLNAVVDIDGSGHWDPEAEWVVRNCPIPPSGPETEVVECETSGSTLVAAAAGWVRILLADRQAPATGWDGSAIFQPGEARGEVEDYFQEDFPPATPAPTPTPTGTPAETPTPTPTEPGGVIYTDPPDDSQQMDDEGKLTGTGLPGHPSDLRTIQMMWVTEDGELFLEVWVFRAKTGRSFSSAVQVWMIFSETNQWTLRMLWQDHAEQITILAEDAQGMVTDPKLVTRAVKDGTEVHFRIPVERIHSADGIIVRSFDKPVDGQLRGYDETEFLPLPPR